MRRLEGLLVVLHHNAARFLVVQDVRDGAVEFFEIGDVVVAERNLGGGDQLLELLDLGDADHRRGDDRFAEHPSERDLGGGVAAFFGELGDAVDDVELHVSPIQAHGAFRIAALRAFGTALVEAAFVGAGQHAAGQRRPRCHRNAFRLAIRMHLALLLAVDKVVVVLHRNELMPAVTL